MYDLVHTPIHLCMLLHMSAYGLCTESYTWPSTHTIQYVRPVCVHTACVRSCTLGPAHIQSSMFDRYVYIRLVYGFVRLAQHTYNLVCSTRMCAYGLCTELYTWPSTHTIQYVRPVCVHTACVQSCTPTFVFYGVNRLRACGVGNPANRGAGRAGLQTCAHHGPSLAISSAAGAVLLLLGDR